MRDANEPPAWLIVMQREIVVRAMNKAYLIGLLITLLLIAGIAGFFAWQSKQVDTHDVAVVAGDRAAVPAVEQAAAPRVWAGNSPCTRAPTTTRPVPPSRTTPPRRGSAARRTAGP
jgi:hypothetical protein